MDDDLARAWLTSTAIDPGGPVLGIGDRIPDQGATPLLQEFVLSPDADRDVVPATGHAHESRRDSELVALAQLPRRLVRDARPWLVDQLPKPGRGVDRAPLSAFRGPPCSTLAPLAGRLQPSGGAPGWGMMPASGARSRAPIPWAAGMESIEISDAFLTLAELAVAIAGFSGIILVFVERPESLRAEDRIRIFQLFSVSITSMPLALIPYALALMGLRGPAVWRISSGIAAINQLVLTGVYLRLFSGLTASERANLLGTTFGRRMISLAIGLFTGAALVLLVLNSSALLLHGEQWAYFLVLVGAVTMSAAYLLLIVLIRPGSAV